MKLKNYMWEIWKCAEEENNDGDNFNPDLGVSSDLFISGITGGVDSQYQVLDTLDVSKLRAEWEALDPYEQKRQKDEVDQIIDRNYKALCAAFNEGNREKFRAIILFNS